MNLAADQLPTSEPAIETFGLTRRFGDKVAVDSLDLHVAPGEIFGLVGPDGAGKTTTLRMLAAILDPSEGQARVAGFDVRTDTEAIKDHTAYMSQRFGLYTDLTVQENIDFYADLYGVPRRHRTERVDTLLGFSGMKQFKKRRAGQLSGGMKQKLQLVCALIHTPRVLLLDEPTNGVDPVSRRDFWRVLYQLLQQGVAILVTTAYLDEAERCHRVGLLHQGRLLASGTPDEVKASMQEQILVIRTPRPHEATQVLRAAKQIANIFGDTVHMVCADPVSAAERARHVLSAAAIAVEATEAVPPNLEDLFVQMVRPVATSSDAQSVSQPELAHRVTSDGPAVVVQDLTRRFGKFTAVDRISFQVAPGEIFGIL